MKDNHCVEVEAGQRFEFGKNWKTFLPKIDDSRILCAEDATKAMLGPDGLIGKSFLDVGSGSGLFSLVALRLGASSVHSFDYDLHSVECTKALKLEHYPHNPKWTIEKGSVLDVDYLKSLGRFDVVYSWGVLHHTGHLWQALQNVVPLVGQGGRLYISIYNYQPFFTAYWKAIKRTYNRLPRAGQAAMEMAFLLPYTPAFLVLDAVRGRNPRERWTGHGHRGMSMYVDMRDWLGGYPFEVASPEEIFRFYRDRGFVLRELKTCGGRQGCNQFVFEGPRQSFAHV